MPSHSRAFLYSLFHKLFGRTKNHQGMKSALTILTIPAEVRDKIFRYVFVGTIIRAQRAPGAETSTWTGRHGGSACHFACLFTCQQFFEEALPILYATAMWDIQYSAALMCSKFDASDADERLAAERQPFMPDRRLLGAMPFITCALFSCTSILHLNRFPAPEILRPCDSIVVMRYEKQFDHLTDEEVYDRIPHDKFWNYFGDSVLAKHKRNAISKLVLWVDYPYDIYNIKNGEPKSKLCLIDTRKGTVRRYSDWDAFYNDQLLKV